ncbi:MAG: hypothetical protein ACRYFX_03925 [Janthinobacterium lividum]
MNPELPPADSTSADDHLLEDLASITGFFNPENIWHQEELLDQLDAADESAAPPGPAPTAAD